MVWQKVRKFLRNPYFARTTNDRIAVCVVVCGAHLALWYETCHVPEHYQLSSLTSTIHTVIAILLYISSLTNIYKMARTRTAVDLGALGVSEDVRWPYCERCMLHRPPRTHHCPACDVCILRRDHHCWFAGCCVGHTNQRYYVCAVVYMFLAAAYSNVFHWVFVLDTFRHLGHFGMPICLTVPHMCAVFGFLSLYEFLVATLTFIAAMLVVVLGVLVLLHSAQIVYGQTRFERKHNDTTYDNGLVNNMCSVFGERWYVAWLWPWIHSPLPENGVRFKVSELKTK